ncbi:HNH endonuclease, partial [Paenibacillus artemisiicola]
AAGTGDAAAEQAPLRKRKRKRRRGKAAKRQAGRDAEAASGGGRRPPNRVIHPVKGNFSFKTSLLNDRGRGMIRLRGRRETGKRWSTEIPTEMAVRMVEEGAAGIIHPGLIHKLYTKADFRILVLQRDDYVCRYCGNYGDTIDHVLPKSKGGLSTPANCVCACAECNLKKADSLDYVDDEALPHYYLQS